MKKNDGSKGISGRVTDMGGDATAIGGFEQVIGGGTALIRGKKPTFTASNAKKRGGDGDIVTDPLGSWTGVPVDPYDKPIQDADDL